MMAFVCLFAFVSCKDNSSDGFEPESVEGLWKLESTEGDLNYVNITSTTVTFYDYQGDEFDEGEDCYIIESQEIEEIDGNIYKFEDPENPGSTIDIEITVDDDRLTVEQPFGNGTVTVNFTRFSGNVNTFTPECEESQLKAKVFGFQTLNDV